MRRAAQLDFRTNNLKAGRHLVALSAALYLVFALLSPLVIAVADGPRMPVCCRRAGMHHCAGTAAISAGDGAAVSNGQRCPMWPRTLAASHVQVFAASPAQKAPASLAPQDSVATNNSESRRTARQLQLALRGPPVSHLA
jgi:hypothetical protein